MAGAERNSVPRNLEDKLTLRAQVRGAPTIHIFRNKSVPTHVPLSMQITSQHLGLKSQRTGRVLSLLIGILIAARLQAQTGGPTQPTPPMAFVHVNVIPMDHESVLTDQTVIVAAGKNVNEGPPATTAIPPNGAGIEA